MPHLCSEPRKQTAFLYGELWEKSLLTAPEMSHVSTQKRSTLSATKHF